MLHFDVKNLLVDFFDRVILLLALCIHGLNVPVMMCYRYNYSPKPSLFQTGVIGLQLCIEESTHSRMVLY